jgi:hypothetical protein
VPWKPFRLVIAEIIEYQSKMKNFCLVFLFALVSCTTTQKLATQEDQLFISRKYVGMFIDYRVTTDPTLLWIKTDNPEYGHISAYNSKCEFIPGEKLYIRKKFLNPGSITGYWVYQIEGDQSRVSYKLSEFQHDKKVLVKSWF